MVAILETVVTATGRSISGRTVFHDASRSRIAGPTLSLFLDISIHQPVVLVFKSLQLSLFMMKIS